jgi:integrase/recombinase XerD
MGPSLSITTREVPKRQPELPGAPYPGGLSPRNARRRSLYVLKHSLATHLIDGNVNLAVVKRALGHKSINSTMIYVTVTDRQAGDLSRAALMGLY